MENELRFFKLDLDKMVLAKEEALSQLVSVGVKTGRSRVRGAQAVSLRINGNRGQWGHDVYPGLGPLKGGKTLRPA